MWIKQSNYAPSTKKKKPGQHVFTQKSSIGCVEHTAAAAKQMIRMVNNNIREKITYRWGKKRKKNRNRENKLENIIFCFSLLLGHILYCTKRVKYILSSNKLGAALKGAWRIYKKNKTNIHRDKILHIYVKRVLDSNKKIHTDNTKITMVRAQLLTWHSS